MKKLYELLRQDKIDGDVGIEIECEGNNLVPVNTDTWNTVADGSLRGAYPEHSCEWVLTQPVVIKEVQSALTELEKAQAKATLNFSFRTSVHVHVNVQDLTLDEVMNMIYAYLLCETALMRSCGESRQGNRFCLRLEDAEALTACIIKLIRSGETKFAANNPGDLFRYASINLLALWKYGSLEFRGMEGTLDIKRISTWCTTLVNIREFAKKFKNIQEVHDHFVTNTPTDFIKHAVGNTFQTYDYPDLESDMRRNFSYTIDIPYAYKSMEAKLVVKDEKITDKRKAFNEVIAEQVMINQVVRIPDDIPEF